MNFNNHARCDTVPFSTLRPRQNGRHFADNIFKCILLNENVWIPIKISLNFFTKGPINNIPSLVQIMVWRRPGAKPLSEPMMVSLLTHICVTRPEWVNQNWSKLTPFILYTQSVSCWQPYHYRRLERWSVWLPLKRLLIQPPFCPSVVYSKWWIKCQGQGNNFGMEVGRKSIMALILVKYAICQPQFGPDWVECRLNACNIWAWLLFEAVFKANWKLSSQESWGFIGMKLAPGILWGSQHVAVIAS